MFQWFKTVKYFTATNRGSIHFAVPALILLQDDLPGEEVFLLEDYEKFFVLKNSGKKSLKISPNQRCG